MYHKHPDEYSSYNRGYCSIETYEYEDTVIGPIGFIHLNKPKPRYRVKAISRKHEDDSDNS